MPLRVVPEWRVLLWERADRWERERLCGERVVHWERVCGERLSLVLIAVVA